MPLICYAAFITFRVSLRFSFRCFAAIIDAAADTLMASMLPFRCRHLISSSPPYIFAATQRHIAFFRFHAIAAYAMPPYRLFAFARYYATCRFDYAAIFAMPLMLSPLRCHR